jgi:phosphoribosylamine--glycine ligase
MNVLVIGSGGREHAIAWHIATISESDEKNKVYVWPGNACMSDVATIVEGVASVDELVNFAKENKIEWTVVGPENFLADGIVDRFESENLKIFGPKKEGSILESSKDFTKEFLVRHNIPTAAHRTFTNYNKAYGYVSASKVKVVLKADGLAAGKGVFLPETEKEAKKLLKGLLEGDILGEAGRKVVVEEFVEGPEMSYMIFTDGKSFKALASAKDFKRLLEDDKGPNTGGMGVYSPSPLLTRDLNKRIENEIIFPTINGLLKDKIDYKGVLYVGLFITKDGPKVCEFNVRLGDPETQIVLMRLKTPLTEIFEAVRNEKLDTMNIEWSDEVSGGVVLAAPGYPSKYKKGIKINNIEKTSEDNITVFHAGTTKKDNQICSNGGRVLNLVGVGSSFAEVFSRVYSAAEKVDFPGVQYRKDICPVPLD